MKSSQVLAMLGFHTTGEKEKRDDKTMTSLTTTQNIIISATFGAAIVVYLFLDNQFKERYNPSWTVNSTSSITNITLQVSGRCRPLVYCGVDSREYLLKDYDAYGTALSFHYSASHMNWARILLIRTVLKKCPPEATKWVFYSDTDAYFESRYRLWNRLKGASRRYTLLFQHGHWLVNSGVEAWRNNNQSFAMLDEWESKFVPNSTDFFAEQSALDKVFSKHISKAVNYPNGFLAWHIKGTIPFKTELSAIGRRFAARSGPAIFSTVLMMISFVALIISLSPSSIDATCSTPIRHRPLYLLGTSYRRAYHAVTSGTSFLIFITLMSFITFTFLAPTGKKLSAAEVSRWDYYHLLPNGRVMRRQRTSLFTPKVWVDAYWHSQYGGFRWRIFQNHVKSKWKLFSGFLLAEVVEWSALVWIYPLLLVIRYCHPLSILSQYSKYTLSAVLTMVIVAVCLSITMESFMAF